MAQLLTHFKFTVDEFVRMVETGILTKEDRVELIEGEIIEMAALGDPHMLVVNLLNYILVRALDGRGWVQIQGAIRLPPFSRSQPDIVIYRWRDDFYRNTPPVREDVLLVIEVADTTLAYDRRVKMPLYSRHDLPESWIVNIKGRAVIIGRVPTPDGYQEVRTVRGSEAFSSLAFPDLVLTPEQLLPNP